MNTRVRLFIWIEFKIRVSANNEHVNQGIRIFIVIILSIICNLETYITYQYMCISYMCISYSAYTLVELRTESAKTDMQTNIHSMLERSTTKSIVDQDVFSTPVVMQSPSMTSQRETSMAHQTRLYLFMFSIDIVFLLVFM